MLDALEDLEVWADEDSEDLEDAVAEEDIDEPGANEDRGEDGVEDGVEAGGSIFAGRARKDDVHHQDGDEDALGDSV